MAQKTDTEIKTDVLYEFKAKRVARAASVVLIVDNQLSVQWFGYDA